MNRDEKFGGRPSVRRDQTKKMIVKIGHDEAIVKQFIYPKRAGTGQMERQRYCQRKKVWVLCSVG
jgi:hypothetical protein